MYVNVRAYGYYFLYYFAREHAHVRSLRSIRPHSLLQALKWGSNIKRKRAQSKKSFAGSSRALERLAAARLAGDDDDGC